MTYFILTAIIVTFILYKRYFPVLGERCIPMKDLELDNIKIIDVRDYNESYKDPIKGAINIPIAYLKRNRNEIPNSKLYVVASSILEKNVGIRCLRKKGFWVVGFTIAEHSNSSLKDKSLKIETTF